MLINQDRVIELEKLVDNSSLLDTVAALELMCYEKAAHIREHYHNEGLAKSWETCAKALYKANKIIADAVL